MKKSDYPTRCKKCGKVFPNLAGFVEHNDVCKSYGYDIVPGAAPSVAPKKTMATKPKDVMNDVLKAETSEKEGVKVIDTSAPKKRGRKPKAE